MYGCRQGLQQMSREGTAVARRNFEQLMLQLDLQSARRGKKM
jgi:hypothetical protein